MKKLKLLLISMLLSVTAFAGGAPPKVPLRTPDGRIVWVRPLLAAPQTGGGGGSGGGGSNVSPNPATLNGIVYGNGTTTLQVTAAGGAGTLCLTETAGGAPSFGSCSGTSSTAWSALTASTNSGGGNFIMGTGSNLTVSGTGTVTATSLNVLTTLGDLLYENVTPANARLAGNTTTTKNFLVQTGNGTISAAPAWGTIACGDLPALTGDTTTSAGSCATTTAKINGTTVGASWTVLGTNGSSQPVQAALTTGDVWNGSSNLPSATPTPTLGVANSTAGTLTLANSAALASTILASGATTTNTIKGFATAPTTGDAVSCTTASTTCTLTDAGGPIPANTTSTSHQWFNAYTQSTGAFTKTQPALSDLTATFSAPLSLSTNTLSITGAAGQVLAGSTPAFTATPSLGTDGSVAGTLQLANGSAAFHTIIGTGATANWTMTLPATAGSNNQVLSTNGAGVTSWSTVSGTISGLTTGYIPKAASSSTLANSGADDGVTTANTFTYAGSGGMSATSFTATGSGAGALNLTQGTAQTALASSVGFQAPTSVSSAFLFTLPGAPAAGVLHATNATPSVISVSAVANADLTNSSLTFNGQAVSLGSSGNVNAGATSGTLAVNNGNGSALTGLGGANADYIPITSAANTFTTTQVNGGADCGDGTHAVKFTAATGTFGCQALTTGGAGTVTSVATTAPLAGGTITSTGTLSITGAAGQVLAGASPAFTATPTLGTAGSVAGTLTLANSGAAFSNTLSSAATANNTVAFFATVPTTTHLVSCVVSSVTCTLTDSGIASGNVATTTSGGAISFDKSNSGLINPTADATFTYPNTSTTGHTLAGTAPASVGTSTGTNASSIFNVSGVTGGADSNATGTAGVGSSPSITTGNGGAGTGTNTVGGSGGNFSVTTGNGGASLGTGANANGGNAVFSMGIAGVGGSGALGTAGQFQVTGTAPSSVAGNGAAVGTIFDVLGVAGGATSSTSANTGGTGSAAAINGGTGGAATGVGGNTTVGGVGGAITLTAGTGGAGSAGNNSGGAGGNINLVVGSGGAKTGTGSVGAAGVVAVTGAETISSTLGVTGHVTFEGVTSTGATGTGNLVFSASPTFSGTVTIPTLSLTNALTVANGGTGLQTLTAHNFMLGEGTSNVGFLSCGAGTTVLGNAADPTCSAALVLGTDNSVAGTVQTASSGAAFHNIWGSSASMTATNTILGPLAVPTTGHLLDCSVSSTTCTLHDSGVVTANVVNASSPGVGIAHFAGSTQTVTSSTIATGDIAANAVTSAKVDSSVMIDTTNTTTTQGELPISTTTAGTYAVGDFWYPEFIPAANCNNTTAGAGWSIPSGGTVTCRAGTNNLGGYVTITDTSSTFAQFMTVIPFDWDTATRPYIRFYLASASDTTNGHTVIPQVKVSCSQAVNGTTSDDATLTAAQSSSTITFGGSAVANGLYASSNVQFGSTQMSGCVAGGLFIVQVGRATDTATGNINFYGASISWPRLNPGTAQAN